MIVDENCGPDCSRTKRICKLGIVPPMLGDGKPVDLIKLYLAVRDRGGYDAVSGNGLWGVVAEECGLALDLSPLVKLVYVKYLDMVEKRLEGIDGKDLSDRSSALRKVSIELSAELKELLEIRKWTAPNTSTDMDFNGDLNGSQKCAIDDEESVHLGTAKSGSDDVKAEDLSCDLLKSVSNGTDDVNADSSELSIHKRKRESVSRILNWVTGVAMGPCDEVVDPLPGCSKWGSYGSQEVWKQALLIREALFQKSNLDSGSEQSAVKKNRKMHPSLYDSQTGSAYNFRERLKAKKNLFLHEKTPSKPRSQSSSSNTKTDSNSYPKGIPNGDSPIEYSLLDLPVEKVIPLGPDFQADVAEWTGIASQSDSKWLGTPTWPPEKADNRYIVEREPIGKGRQDSCGCEFPKSIRCVRFHIAERRLRVNRELGMAFYNWGFDKMGEDVKLGWKNEEEKKFKAIVQLNPPSLDKCFWDEIVKYFITKKREEIVGYYFNVFLLQRRAHQNRVTPNSIDSDDDYESEGGSEIVSPSSKWEPPKSPGSLLCAKKSRKNVK